MDRLSAIIGSLSKSIRYIAGVYPISSISITDAVSLYGNKELKEYQVIQISFLMGVDQVYYDRYYSTVFFFLKKMDGVWVCNPLLTYVKGIESCYIDRFNACRQRIEAFYNAFIDCMQGNAFPTKIISVNNDVNKEGNPRVVHKGLIKGCIFIKIFYE